MDALVYEDTPLATYFEGEAVPYEFPQEETPPPTPFAPRGLPDFKGRLRQIRRSATSIAPGSAYTEELLERFRYIIVASQLLSDEGGPHAPPSDHETMQHDLTTLRGATGTAVTSFVAAWGTHWIKTRKRVTKTLTWLDVGTCCIGLAVIALAALFFGRRQYTNYVQRASVRTLSKYVDDSHSFDTAANNVVRFIQEVEVVARGYDLGSILPPISRLEDRQLLRRCLTLRRELGAALKLLTTIMVQSHNAVQPYINTKDVQRYHDIYEVSLVEYTQAIELANQNSEDTQESLKELRFAIKLHALARKVLLCDLLAFQQSKGRSRLQQWNRLLQVLREAAHATTRRQKDLSQMLAEEEWGLQKSGRRSSGTTSQSDTENTTDSAAIGQQLRRFEDVAYSVRGLNARVHLIREEVSGLTNADPEDSVVSCALSKHYELLGAEIRNLLFEWERNKSAVMYPMESDQDRASCSTGSIQTPVSPSPTLGGLQIVDGGPADALRLLNGDSPPSNQKGIFEEEVFEAVASRLPRKRMSMGGMSREEKIAKLAEERKKRQTFQEQADNTTSMLRELQMVIKHRPKGSLPANTSTNNSFNGNRIASP